MQDTSESESESERESESESDEVMGWADFASEEAPGWRMLSSLPSCPNPHMRFPMSRELFRRVSG